MGTAAYCDQCEANVYVRADGSCPHGHAPEHLSAHYEVADGQRPTVKVARYALLIIVIVALLTIGCSFFACTALLRDDPEAQIPSAPAPTAPAISPEEQLAIDAAAAGWYAEGPVETDFVIEFVEIEQSAFAAMDVIDETYPAQTDDSIAAAVAAVASIETAYREARALDVPPKYEAIQQYFVAGLESYSAAVTTMAVYDFRQLQGDTYEEVSTLLDQSTQRFQQMLDAIYALELVWGE